MAPRQSYGSITVKNEGELESLVPPVAYPNNKKKYIASALGALVLACLGVHYVFTGDAETPSSGPSKQSGGIVDYDKYDKSLILSKESPIDLGFLSTEREAGAQPSKIWGNRTGPLPTNSWYLNLVSQKAAEQPDDATRAYTVPYIIDMAPPKEMAGIRVHWPVVSAGEKNIQMVDDFKNGLSLGSKDIDQTYRVNPNENLSNLGVGFVWNKTSDGSEGKSMATHIVRGMPFATMHYSGGTLPSIYSYNGPATGNSPIVADGSQKMECGTKGSGGKTYSIKEQLEMHFINSDFTWAVYFSRPVKAKCEVAEGDEKTRDFELSIVSYDEGEDPLTVRVALINECTTGEGNIKAHCTKQVGKEELAAYAKVLKDGAAVFPTSSQIAFAYPKEGSKDRIAKMTIDWGAQIMTTGHSSSTAGELLMYALPHHQEQLLSNTEVKMTKQCVDTFHGPTCLVRGNVWVLDEDLGAPMSLNARRPPAAEFIPTLAKSLTEDINYKLSDNMLRAAADTYFPGKILARVARVIAISAEMEALASGKTDSLGYDDVDKQALAKSVEAASSEVLPSKEEITKAVDHLKKGVQAWLKKDAEAPFVFDKSWGGFVNCGCRYHGKGPDGYCNNTFPDCPALADVNEDFGNGWYNDHHYHYGYHVYAAAVVAKYDPEWAEEYFERVLLYIRDFASPSASDEYFTQFRQKDWFLGSSWASGIVSAENSPHGRNEESSSEAIAAYEGMALYGQIMTDLFSKAGGKDDKLKTAQLVRDAGQLLTATELRATNRYWHVWSSDDHKNTYPAAYQRPVVGMLYDTMATFQTWFAPWAVVSYGIQLMPFTAIAEQRDDPRWAAELYPLYKEACETAGDFCIDNGWSILQAGLRAEAGDKESALEQVLSIPAKVFDSLGGVGNSVSNIVWFISTRSAFDGKVGMTTTANSTSMSGNNTSA